MNKRVDWGEHFDNMPATRFLRDLYKMTPEQRAKASAERAAKRYGIKQDWAQFCINEARRDPAVWPVTGGG